MPIRQKVKKKEMTTKAAKTATEKPADNGNYQAPDLTPPKGFEDGSNPDIDGWYKPKVGEICTGQIKGHILLRADSPKKKDRDVVLVTLEAPIVGFLQGGDEIALEPGMTIGITVTHDLRGMLLLVENHGSIWITPTEKKSLAGGNSLWKFKQYYKGIKAPLSGQSANNDDFDF